MSKSRVRPLRVALIATIIATAATIVAHATLGLVPALGAETPRSAPLEAVIEALLLPAYPGAIIGWMMIWGDNYSDSMREHLIQAAISIGFNVVLAFGVTYVPLAAWQHRRKFQFGTRAMLIGVSILAVVLATLIFALRFFGVLL